MANASGYVITTQKLNVVKTAARGASVDQRTLRKIAELLGVTDLKSNDPIRTISAWTEPPRTNKEK